MPNTTHARDAEAAAPIAVAVDQTEPTVVLDQSEMPPCRAVSQMPRRQRPQVAGARDRLETQGQQTLTDSELLSIVIGTGAQGMNAQELAQCILAEARTASGLMAMTGHELEGAGLGKARAALVQAALELGRRAASGRPIRGHRLAGASEVFTYMRGRLACLSVEEFWMIGLDVRHRVQTEACLARGSLTGVEVHPRDAFRPLIRQGIAAVIFVHNHPSGDPSPSRADVELTNRLREVGELCGIPVLDHVVIGWEGYCSLAERNWR